MQFKLVSFTLCPYVQRAVITLRFKKVPFKIEYIDLENKPEWFLKISPLGKVPVLMVNGNDVIFESTVINELLDELNQPVTLSADPVKKAKERAWIMYSDTLIAELHTGLRTRDSAKYFDNLMDKLARLEDVISEKGFFKEEGFSVIDSAYAPVFFRMQYVHALANHPKLMQLKKVHKWYENVLAQEYVKQSVRADFESQFKERLLQSNPELKFVSKGE